MKKITVWTPDTCECEVHYEWDTDDHEDNRTHTAHPNTKPCEHHRGTHHETHAKVVAENQKKNRAVGVLAEKLGIEASAVTFRHDAKRSLRLAVAAHHKIAARKHLDDAGHTDVVIE